MAFAIPIHTPAARVLVVNPNTNPAVTYRVRQVVEPFVHAGLQMEVCNPSRGPFSIENGVQRSEAEQAVLSLLRALPAPRPDVIVLACFDDLALHEARKLTARPVVGTCEAGISAARAHALRFAIVTTVHDAVPGIRVLMQRYGAGPQATVRAAGIGVADAARADAQALDRIVLTARAAIHEDGAQAILLASGGLTGLAPELADRLGVPVVDGVQAAIAQAVALVRHSV